MKTWVAVLLLSVLAVPAWADQGYTLTEKKANDLLIRFYKLDKQCRHQSVKSPACREADEILSDLFLGGQCYEEKGPTGYSELWVPCSDVDDPRILAKNARFREIAKRQKSGLGVDTPLRKLLK